MNAPTRPVITGGNSETIAQVLTFAAFLFCTTIFHRSTERPFTLPGAIQGGMCQARNIRYVTELSVGPLIVAVEEQQIEQVLVNVIKNAAESIG
jgi:signal transduction histidine kinase